MNKIKMMCGVPGSGKSSFIRNHAKPEDVIVSRDKIRFAMVKEDEPYFSKEKAVFKEFIRQIVEALAADKTVWVDATHLNEASREKMLSAVEAKINIDSIEAYEISCPVEVAIAQNKFRINTRAYVPEETIYSMIANQTRPQYDKRTYDAIYYCYNDLPIKKE